MKYLFFLLCSMPFLASAQDCGLKKEIDQFSQQPKISTGFLNFSSANGRVSLDIVADSKEIKLLFTAGEGVCFDENSSASFSFEGTKTKTKQKNYSTMNCEGIFTIVFRNVATTPFALQKIAQKKASSIVLTDNSEKEIVLTLKPEEQEWLSAKAACIISEAKTLIK